MISLEEYRALPNDWGVRREIYREMFRDVNAAMYFNANRSVSDAVWGAVGRVTDGAVEQVVNEDVGDAFRRWVLP